MSSIFQRAFALLFVVAGVSSSAAQADTLSDAMSLAYETNPVLIVNRAGLRATDEGVAQARAARRPTITGINSYTIGVSHAIGVGRDYWDENERLMMRLNASLTIYDGGRTRIAIEAAKEAVLSARASLNNLEQSVMLNAAVSFLNVRRDLQFVALSRNNVTLLGQQLQASQDRFAAGAATRTDVAQTEARLAAAQAVLAARRGGLAISQEAYRAAVGVAPVNLAAPPRLPTLPGSQIAAEDIAIREHPLLLASRHAEKSALLDLRRARGVRLPTVSLEGNADYTTQFNSGTPNPIPFLAVPATRTERYSMSLGITSTMPLYTGGAISSAIRQAGVLVELRMAETQNLRVSIRQQVGGAWFQVQIARSTIAANTLQIEAAQFALEGTRQEADLGARTILDVLNAEQEVLDARSNLINAMHDEHVASYNLLAAMGLLTVDNLNLSVKKFNPDDNYDRVQRAPIQTFGAAAVLDNISDRWN